MKIRRTAVLLLFFLLLSGCGHRRQPASSVRVVSEITVTHEQQGLVTRQIYTDPDKLRRILNAIRNLGQKFNPTTDPETLPLTSFHIILRRTDGTEQIYRTKADRYIRIDHEPWQQTDPESLTQLTQLLQNLSGDIPEVGKRRDIPRSMDWAIGLRYGTPEQLYRIAINRKTPRQKPGRFERTKNYS